MGLNFSKASVQSQAAAVEKPKEIEVQPYDIVADRKQMNEVLVNSQEVDAIVSAIEIDNMDSIVSLGADAAEAISRASDVVLNNVSMSQLDASSEMLGTLAKIMDQFDIEEIKDDSGFLGKLFGNFKKKLDKILDKYHTMGDEVDKIYVQLKQYEAEIKKANKNLDQMLAIIMNL